jgi:hypothetical protein
MFCRKSYGNVNTLSDKVKLSTQEAILVIIIIIIIIITYCPPVMYMVFRKLQVTLLVQSVS